MTRRRFLGSVAAAGVGLAIGESDLAAATQLGRLRPGPVHPGALPGRVPLSETFADLHRHFIFEYYPWYSTSPWRHWDEASRNPPVDIAANYMPALGAYDSASTKVMEQHARWIAEAGVGAINVSWWGRDSDIDRLVPALMDVMAAHDIHVTFHLEPYRDHHAEAYADDIRYLIAKYGDGRRWDCFLLLQDAAGRARPVFKSFRTILPATSVDCHGTTSSVSDYAPDDVWRQQTDQVRQTFKSEFDGVTLLADSLDIARTARSGFDGIAIYDNFVRPDTWQQHAQACTASNLVFSFNVNPGFDGISLRQVDPNACDQPPVFEPGGASYEWTRSSDREAAASASRGRITQSFKTTIALQTSARLRNAQEGFFLTYINSFNEWHEGHAFEPMKAWNDLSPAERAIGYHNPEEGAYRLQLLTDLLGEL